MFSDFTLMTKWCLTLYLLLLVCKCVSEWVNVFPSVPKVLGVQSEGRFDLDGLVQHKQPAVAKTKDLVLDFHRRSTLIIAP